MTQSSGDEVEILIIAAEASSALYAQRLLEHWRNQKLKVKAFGIGNKAMVDLGFEAIGRAEDLAVVGLTEVIKHYGQIKKVFYKLIEEVESRRPKVILLLDYPDFNLRLAKKLKKYQIPIIYYISPQVWAWRKSRIHDIKKLVDKMLVLLPFEKQFYADHGVNVEFVGHPLLDELKPALFDANERMRERNKYGVRNDQTWVGLMPGSRMSELKHHLKLQIEAAEKLYEQHKNTQFALIVAPSISKESIQNLLPPYSIPLIIIQGDPLAMVSLMDLVLCASGTATLVVGLLLKPMVIMYRMNPFSAWLAKKIVKGTAHFGLVNLILGKRAVPELFQEEASVEGLARELGQFMSDKKLYTNTVSELAMTAKLLGSKGATHRVAEVLKPYLF